MNNFFDQESMEYAQLYLDGIKYFNGCDFFEAHEAWEDHWTEYRGPLRLFYKGLIQSAVALHHFGNGNNHGARKVYGTSVGYLEEFRPACEGIDMDKFLAELKQCFSRILEEESNTVRIEIIPDEIPEIHLDPNLEEPEWA